MRVQIKINFRTGKNKDSLSPCDDIEREKRKLNVVDFLFRTQPSHWLFPFIAHFSKEKINISDRYIHKQVIYIQYSHLFEYLQY